MKTKSVILFVVLLMGVAAMAADLPSKGLEPAVTATAGPGAYPNDPTVPIGGGLFILLGMSATYFLVKRKRNQ